MDQQCPVDSMDPSLIQVVTLACKSSNVDGLSRVFVVLLASVSGLGGREWDWVPEDQGLKPGTWDSARRSLGVKAK